MEDLFRELGWLAEGNVETAQRANEWDSLHGLIHGLYVEIVPHQALERAPGTGLLHLRLYAEHIEHLIR